MFTALLLVTAVASGWGQAILTETFNYPTPAYVGGNGAAGTSSNGWTTHSLTAGQTTTVDIQDGSLSYPGLAASTGNKVYLFSNANATSRDINSGFTSSTASAMYYSALVNVVDNSQITAAGDYFMTFGATAGTAVTSLGGRLGVKSTNSGANFRFCIQNISTGTPTFTDCGTDLTFGTTYLVVVKFDRSTAPTTATLWVNPATLGGAEAAGSVSNASGTATFAAFTSICLRNSATTPKAQIDEIRVGTTFADVTPADITAPVATFSPASAAVNVAITSPITITYDEAIRNIDDSPIADPTSLITLKETDASGAAVAFTSAIDVAMKVITITPSASLKLGQAYYVAIAPVEDASNNATVENTSTFTIRAAYTNATVTSATYTVTDASWTISNIPAGVSVATLEGKLTPAAGATIATFEVDGITPATGNVLNGYKVKVTAEDGTTINIYTLVVTPTLNAATLNNDVDHSFDITFTDDAAWRAAITAVKVDATTLTATTDYTIAAGVITLIPSGGNSALTVSGSKSITVVATDYADATATQVINAGALNPAKSTISNAPAMGIGTTSTVTITAKDQFENLVPGYVFKYDAAITNGDATNTESYTIAGVATTASVADVDLTATNASGVATFDIVVPATVDPTDGISVQVQLNDGTTNFGSSFSYLKPAGPSVSAIATLSETTLNAATVELSISNESFADATLDKANFSLNNAPVGVTVSDVTYNSATSATVTLAYDGTDFDVDVTTMSITVAGAEMALGNPLTSNSLTVTALVETEPVVATNATITTLGFTTATWGGDVSADGGEAVIEKGICWSTVANPTIADSKTTEGAGIGAIVGDMINLTVGTKYYVRAYATNVVGTNYGTEYSFTTQMPIPAFTATYPKSANVGYNKFDVVVNTDAIGKVYFLKLVSGAAAPTSADVKSTGTAINVVAASTDYSATINGLTPTTTYDVYFVTENTTGDLLMASPVLLSVATTVQTSTSIYDIQFTTDASGDSPLANQSVVTEGIVTAVKYNSSAVQQGFYLQDAPGAWNGVYVFSSTPVVQIGDKVSVTGTVAEYNKLTEITPLTASSIISSGNALPSATVVTALDAQTEGYEGVLVTVKNLNCTSGSSGSFVLSDGTANITAYKNLFSTFALTLNASYDITGVMAWASSVSLYEIYPRSAADIINKDANLSDLSVNGTTVAGFSAATITYNVELPFGSAIPVVSATATDVANAGVVVTQATSTTGSATVVVTAQDGTTVKTYTINFTVAAAKTGKDILTFAVNNEIGTSTIGDGTIAVEVAATADVTTLVATFTLSDAATVKVGTNDQVSGTTANDFTSPVTYTVTAQDGTSKDWIVTVTKSATLSTEANITSFIVAGVTGTIDATGHTVALTVPFGTNVTALVPTIVVSGGASVSPASGVAQDFTSAVTYTVTAEDGIAHLDWVVTVSIAPAPAPLFTAGYPKSANIGSDKFDVVVSANAVGKAYFLKLASGAAAPTSADVKSTGVAIDILAATTDYSATITGLTASTTYDVYFVTENATGDVLMASPVKLSVATVAAGITIHDIQYTTDASGNTPLAGTPVTFNGTVIEIKHNSTTGAQQGFYVQDAPGAWNGVYVYSSSAVVAVGDNVTISGTPKEYNGLTEIDPVTNVTVVSQGNTLPASAEITTQTACTEAYESVLVTVKNVTCASGSAGSFVVNDGSGDLTAYKSLFPAFDLTIGSHYDLTGIMTWFSTASLYELYPRNANDVVPVTGIDNNNAVATKAYPNPFSTDINISAGKVVRTVTVSNMLGQKVMERSYNESTISVPASDLKDGIYIVNIRFEDGTSTALRMVKK